MFADAGEHVLQGAPLRRVIENVVGRDEWRAAAQGKLSEPVEPRAVIAPIINARCERDAAGKDRDEMLQARGEGFTEIVRRHRDEPLTLAEHRQVIQGEMAFAL